MTRRAMVFALAVVLGLVTAWPLPAAAQLTNVSITADKASLLPANTTITLTATATGGTTPYQTKWFVTTNGWKTFSVLQNWATDTVLAWTPATAGQYSVGVWMRSAGNMTDAPEGGFGDVGQLSFQILSSCNPTPGKTPDQDVQRGQCLFNSTIMWGQANPTNIFATCNGCHPGGGTDQGTHPVLLTNSQNQKIVVPRQAPDLRNVTINLPLGWDGRHGGVPGDMASINAAIQSAAAGAINSPVEMAGKFDPADPADQDKMASLVAFLVSRSPTQPSTAPAQPTVLDPATAANVTIGAAVFFGRSASTQGLLTQGKACISCHPPPAFTNNTIQGNVLNSSAAFEFGFPSGPFDTGRAFFTGNATDIGKFKTPSLHFFYPTAEPFMHDGIFGSESKLFQFYEKSLSFKLGPGESTGLHYWLVNCPRGIGRSLAAIPPECN